MKLGSVDISRLYIGGTEITKAYLGAVEVYANSQPWDVSGASFVQSFIVSPLVSPSGLFFKPDGTKMYAVGTFRDAVYEYDLSTAWDVSSTSLLQSFNVSAQDSVPEGLFFKPDGTKMYAVGSGNDDIYEYDLSTAWDVSSASFVQAYPAPSNPKDLFFKPDGTKLYLITSATDAVWEYDLSTAWDVSTASFNQNFNVGNQESFSSGLFFKPDGTKMYVSGRGDGGNVHEYDLSISWDVSTASFAQSFNVSAQESGPTELFFKPDGLKMYIVGLSSYAVHEYNLGGA